MGCPILADSAWFCLKMPEKGLILLEIADSAWKLGVPPWSHFCQKIPRFRGFFPWSFSVLRGISRPIWPNVDLFWPILTCFDLFRRADLTYFHLFRPIRRADLTYSHLCRPISFHDKAPWTGHLMKEPDSAWFCLKLHYFLPEIAWKGAWVRLKRRKQKSHWHGDLKVTDFGWFFLPGIVWECRKGVGRWATLLPRALGLSIIRKQTLIMNVSICFLLFEGLYFCFRERERNSLLTSLA